MWSRLRLVTAPHSIYWVFINALNMQIEPMWIAGEIYFYSHWRYGTTCSVIELAAWENSIYPRCVTLPQAESTDIPIWFGSLSSTPLTEWVRGELAVVVSWYIPWLYRTLLFGNRIIEWRQWWLSPNPCKNIEWYIDCIKYTLGCLLNARHM
jgi:hypothetical protein